MNDGSPVRAASDETLASRQAIGAPATHVEESAPKSIGDYELLRELGRGGMGIVYLARQRGLNRLVALKMILPGGSGGAVARFRVEAEAAAHLRHPGIVAVFDVGTEAGRHFYSMEYVDGRDLSQLVGERSLTGREAAEIVAAIADAMHYAHERGVLHRDLKPSNILIDPAGKVKITDFGLAKRVDGDSELTGAAILGTPSYMPPEQAVPGRGVVGPGSDVYAIGAILYQTLTCRPPFRAENPLETIRQLLTTDPVAPRLLNAAIPRDVETICLKCLEKESSRRYGSARELGDELRRFLAGEPILARPLNRVQRGWRWCRRHPAVASLSAVILLLALFAAAGVTSQWLRAERNLDRANLAFERLNTASDQMLTVVEDWVVRLPLDSNEHQETLSVTLSLYEKFLREEPTHVAARIKLAQTHHQLADIRRSQRQFELAAQHFAAAAAEYAQVLRERPDHPQARRWLADEQDWLGETQREAGRLEESQETLRSALATQESLAAVDPSPGLQAEMARSLYNLALLLRDMGDLAGATKRGRLALDLFQQLPPADRERPTVRQGEARCHVNLGMMLREAQEPRAAFEHYEQAATILRELVDEAPRQVRRRELRAELAQTELNRGNLLLIARGHEAFVELDALAESARSFRAAIELFRALVVEYPSVVEYRNELANAWNGLGSNHQVAKNEVEARAAFDHARELFTALVRRSPDSADLCSRLAITLSNLALLTPASDGDAKVELLSSAVEHQSQASRRAPKSATYRSLLRRHRIALVRQLLQLHRPALVISHVEALADDRVEGWKDLRLAATFMARAIPLAADDPSLDEPTRASLSGEYRRKACELLARAVTAGLADRRELEDEVFAPVRSTDEFQAILARLNRP